MRRTVKGIFANPSTVAYNGSMRKPRTIAPIAEQQLGGTATTARKQRNTALVQGQAPTLRNATVLRESAILVVTDDDEERPLPSFGGICKDDPNWDVFKQALHEIDETVNTKAALFEHFSGSDHHTICAFLDHHEDLHTPLVEGGDHIRRIFGKKAIPWLELFRDPEAPLASDELWVMVRYSGSLDDALNRLDTLRREWLVTLPRDIRKRIRADVEIA